MLAEAEPKPDCIPEKEWLRECPSQLACKRVARARHVPCLMLLGFLSVSRLSFVARVHLFLGNRPLSLGRLMGTEQDVWVVASETCAFTPIGADFVREVSYRFLRRRTKATALCLNLVSQRGEVYHISLFKSGVLS